MMEAAADNQVVVQLSETLGDLIDRVTEESPLTEGLEEEIESVKPELRSLLVVLEAAESDDNEEEAEELKSLATSVKELSLLAKTQIGVFISRREKQMKKGKLNKFISTLSNARACSEFRKTLKIIKLRVPEIIEQLKNLLDETESSFSQEEAGYHQQAPFRGVNIIGRTEDMSRVKSRLTSGFVNQFDDFDAPSSQKINDLSDNAQTLIRHIGNYFGFNPTISYGFQQRVQLSAVSIVGIEGVGKTTLASLIYKDTYIARNFPSRAWVNVPHEFQPEELLCSIAKQVGSDEADKRWSLAMLTESIQSTLAEKSSLIVLDDVRTAEVWRLLRQVLPHKGNCNVLITTRVAEVATEASSSSGSIHHLQKLTQQNSWHLFCTVLRDLPDELLPVAQEMVESCRGIPLQILETAGLLLWEAKTAQRWSTLLSELQQKGSLKHLVGDALPSYLKKCLYSLLLFDKDFEIPVRRLVALWIAEGLVLPTWGIEVKPLEDTAKEYLLNLRRYFVIEIISNKSNGEINTCRMRSAIRKVLISKAKMNSFFSEHVSKRVYRLAHHPQTTNTNNGVNDDNWSLYGFFEAESNGSSISYCFKYLRTFSSFDPREGPEPGEHVKNFLHRVIKLGGCKRLRILDLEGVFRPVLPKVLLKELKQLRYLSLRRSYAEVLPASVGSLRKLQTLDLKHTCISIVPVSIWRLGELRHLYLSESYRTRFPSYPSLSISLMNLQTISGGYMDDQSPIENGLDKLKNLRKLAMTCHMSMEKQMELGNWILKSTGLETLRLRSINEKVEPSLIYLENISGLTRLNNLYFLGALTNAGRLLSRLPESLTEITFSLSKLSLDPMPVLGGLANLRSLSLLSDSYIGNSMTCPISSFPKLHFLKLWKLTELEEWNVEERAMSAIEAIEIRSCSKLKFFPQRMKYLTSFQ